MSDRINKDIPDEVKRDGEDVLKSDVKQSDPGKEKSNKPEGKDNSNKKDDTKKSDDAKPKVDDEKYEDRMDKEEETTRESFR